MPVLALNKLISVPYYIRFLICYTGIIIATSHCCEADYGVIFSPTLVKKNKIDITL